MKRDEAAKNIVRRAGAAAAYQGRPYDSNPYDRQTQAMLHLAWSEGHNGARAAEAWRKENQ